MFNDQIKQFEVSGMSYKYLTILSIVDQQPIFHSVQSVVPPLVARHLDHSEISGSHGHDAGFLD